jgi:GntR family transcriptional regulator/MocR family aminotransferase
VQVATAEFMREGHYIRHLRRTKRVYTSKRQALVDYLHSAIGADQVSTPGLAVLLKLPKGTSDIAIAREVSACGMSPSPLSVWYVAADDVESGLLLGVATTPTKHLARSCDQLFEVIRRLG